MQYNELMAQAEALMDQARKLMAQAESVRDAERRQVIQELRAQMAAHGLTLADLAETAAKRSTPKKPVVMGVSYRGPAGQVWVATRGRRPRWLDAAIQQGTNLETLRV